MGSRGTAAPGAPTHQPEPHLHRNLDKLAFEPRSRRPSSSPTALAQATVDLIIELREKLSTAGLDAGPDTIAWHLAQHHAVTVSVATISRYLVKKDLVVPEPRKRPKSSYIRFQASMPNETWQSDFTHYRLTNPDETLAGTPGADVEIISWLDDHSRYALSVTAHARVTGPIVLATFRKTLTQHGIPASTLTEKAWSTPPGSPADAADAPHSSTSYDDCT